MMEKQEILKRLEEIRSEKTKIIGETSSLAERYALMATVADHAQERIDEIDEQFSSVTGLNKKDVSFLFFAVALQCARQYILGTLTQRKAHDESDALAHEIQESLWKDDGKVLSDSARAKKVSAARKEGGLYYATRDEIVFSLSVPYDVIKGTKTYGVGGKNVGLSGINHRYKTLGHDPLLGLVFGTSNIMTNTLTNNVGKTFHVKSGAVSSKGSLDKTAKMLDHVIDRSLDTPTDLGCCLIKQCLHIGSDMYSKEGIVIPGGLVLNQDTIQQITEYGLDFGNLATATAGAGISVLINLLIGMFHRLTYDESVEFSKQLYSVRTRKILLYSNCIASASNLVASVCGATIGVISENPDMVKKAVSYADVGGLITTMHRIFSDVRFINRVKQEFIANQWADYVNSQFNTGGEMYVNAGL